MCYFFGSTLKYDVFLFDWALTPGCLGRPTIDGKTALGASSPAKPALHIPDPLSSTRACTSSSAIVTEAIEKNATIKMKWLVARWNYHWQQVICHSHLHAMYFVQSAYLSDPYQRKMRGQRASQRDPYFFEKTFENWESTFFLILKCRDETPLKRLWRMKWNVKMESKKEGGKQGREKNSKKKEELLEEAYLLEENLIC